jgi:hypothetical protein
VHSRIEETVRRVINLKPSKGIKRWIKRIIGINKRLVIRYFAFIIEKTEYAIPNFLIA